MNQLDKIEEQIVELWRTRDKQLEQLKAEAENKAALERVIAEAKKVLPGLYESEKKLWARYEAAIDELDAVMDELHGVQSKIKSSYGRPKSSVHNSLRLAVKSELQRRRMRERLAKKARTGPETIRKRQAKRLRDTAQEIDRARRRMFGGGGSIDQARDRASQLRDTADELEGKQKREPIDDDAMFIPPDVALRS